MGCSSGVTGMKVKKKPSVSEEILKGPSSIIVGVISSRNTILNQFSDSWAMSWYLLTLETFCVINLEVFRICNVAIKF